MQNFNEKLLSSDEIQKAAMLEKINATLASLGSTLKWKKAPESLKEYEPLKDKKLTMIDDVKGVLESYAPNLTVATNGKASFLNYAGQPLEELVQETMKSNPDIVLTDYNLSPELKGSQVVEGLREQGFSGDIIGFSSDTSSGKDLIKAGAKGVINKGIDEPYESVIKIAKLVSQ